jgi:hypothetical protein
VLASWKARVVELMKVVWSFSLLLEMVGFARDAGEYEERNGESEAFFISFSMCGEVFDQLDGEWQECLEHSAFDVS